MDHDKLLNKEVEYDEINQIYDECINYLKSIKKPEFCDLKNNEKLNSLVINNDFEDADEDYDPTYESIQDVKHKIAANDELIEIVEAKNLVPKEPILQLQFENETKSTESILSLPSDLKSERLRRFSKQLPKIIITQSTASLNYYPKDNVRVDKMEAIPGSKLRFPKKKCDSVIRNYPLRRPGQTDIPKRLVSKSGMENVALITNVPFEKIRLLNDTFHTLINLRWRWIVSGTIILHFSIWLIFAAFWYITALAHYDFEPDPPARGCVTGGHDFLTIFLASVEAQTTIGFGDRTIDEECPESIFLFIMQLILGTGLSGVLTCVVYAKLTRPEKLSRDGVGFSKKAVISLRDGQLCLMIRAWDLNYDHIISSEFTAHFVNTHRTKEGEVVRYYARSLKLEHRQFLLWPITLVHVIDSTSPLYHLTPDMIGSSSFEITVSLKGASASMGTFTQSQTSYLPKEILWGYRFPPVVKYDGNKQKYVIEHKKLDSIEPIDTPMFSSHQLYSQLQESSIPRCPGTPSSFSDTISSFQLQRSSSFRKQDINV